MPKVSIPTTQHAPRWVNTAIVVVTLLALSVLAYLMMTHQPLEVQAEQAVASFLQRVQAQDPHELREHFSTDLKQRFSIAQVIKWFEEQELTPLKDWQIVNTHFFKGKGAVHVQTEQALLRFEFAGSQQTNFCRVDKEVQATALRFMRRLQSGNISAAHKQTVDAYFPGRQGENFPSERLYELYQQLKNLPKVTAGPLTLNGYYDYRQTLNSGSKSWSLSLHHWDYGKSGCRFFVFDVN